MFKTILSIILVFIFVWLQYHIWFGEKGRERIQTLEQKIAEQEDQNKILLKQNRELKAEIQRMRSKQEMLEEQAREKLGLIKKGEIFYRIIPSQE